MSNTDLWDRLGKTDPSHTKQFKRSGGFSGTAIKPMWSFRRMTEEFGACGEGWGINLPSFQVVDGSEGEKLVYCTVAVWHGNREQVVFGVGGDKVVGKNKHGLSSDDEAFKKAFTDAVTNALKLIGVGADVHMGLFDDSKYVNERRNEVSKEQSSVSDESRNRFVAECERHINDTLTEQSLRDWWASQEQRDARRDFELSREDIEYLLGLIKRRIDEINTKQKDAA